MWIFSLRSFQPRGRTSAEVEDQPGDEADDEDDRGAEEEAAHVPHGGRVAANCQLRITSYLHPSFTRLRAAVRVLICALLRMCVGVSFA